MQWCIPSFQFSLSLSGCQLVTRSTRHSLKLCDRLVEQSCDEFTVPCEWRRSVFSCCGYSVDTARTNRPSPQHSQGTVNSSHDFRLWRADCVTSWLAPILQWNPGHLFLHLLSIPILLYTPSTPAFCAVKVNCFKATSHIGKLLFLPLVYWLF